MKAQVNFDSLGGGGLSYVDEIVYMGAKIGVSGNCGYFNVAEAKVKTDGNISGYINTTSVVMNYPLTCGTYVNTDGSNLIITMTANMDCDIVIREMKNNDIKVTNATIANGESKTFNYSYSFTANDVCSMAMYVKAKQ